MSSFLSKVIDDLIERQISYENLTIVLPSQRACVFFKEELLKKLPESTFLPKIWSIEMYIQDLADIHLIDTTQLLFEFYEVYLQYMPKEHLESFDSFSQWATIALSDFNEIDSYLVNTKDFFTNLRDLKKLNEWFQDKKPSKLAENYLQFFEYLNILYDQLYQRLKNNKFAYQGLIYREATENLEFYIDKKLHNSFTAFIGFNALNKAEEYIIQELLNSNIATIYWDAHESFLSNSNESGTFLRKYKSEWAHYKKNDFQWVENGTVEQQICIIGAPKNVSQIKYAGELLSKETDFSKTALVLASESLLPLTLNSLPPNIKQINITMGYPLLDIPVSALFEKYFKLHLNQEKFSSKSKKQYYYKDVLNLLNDSFLNKLYGDDMQRLIGEIKAKNSIFLSLDTMEKMGSELEIANFSMVLGLFEFPENINDVIGACSSLIVKMKDSVESIEKEYLFRLYQVFQQLESLNLKYNHITDLKTLYQFFKQILRNEKLAFQGEPLQGLQLMGMLETRALDFDTVILTSVNEGILPGGKNSNSLIPLDIKKYFGMPTYQEKDAIFSYHFQRLIHRAKKVYLIYNTETDGYGSGEKSRFITQLEIKDPSIEKIIVSPKVQKNLNTEEITIPKSPKVLERLKEVFTQGISPSAIANYIYNPVSFYEQKVLRIKEVVEVEETIAANTMGSVIHDVLEALYKPYLGKYLILQNIQDMYKNLDELIQKYFRKHYANGNLTVGKNKLIFEVCKNYIIRFLENEKQLLVNQRQLKIIALEENLKTNITIAGIDFPICINGIVDRIDELDGVIRVMDYKTGKVDANQLKIPDFGVLKEDYKYTKALQIMLYSYLYSKSQNFDQAKPMEAGIISFKNLNKGFLKMNFSEKRGGAENYITTEKREEFMTELQSIIKEILTPEIPFVQNKNLPF